jgi:hypothetical protein
MPSEIVYDPAEVLEATPGIPIPPVVSVEDLLKFELQYFAGKFGMQRFGQAFLCEFHDLPEVKAHYKDHKLWEAKGVQAAKARMRELGFIY